MSDKRGIDNSGTGRETVFCRGDKLIEQIGVHDFARRRNALSAMIRFLQFAATIDAHESCARDNYKARTVISAKLSASRAQNASFY